MIKKKALVQLLEARVNEAGDRARGLDSFIHGQHGIREILGITEDDFGRPAIAKGSARPEEFSLRTLAESICGHQFVEEYFDPSNGPDRRTLLEAGPGVDPTAFLNISAFSLAVGGLVEAKIIERFNNPAFIGDQLVSVRPTRMNGEKLIGVTGIGDKAQSRKPGQAHARAGFGEHYVTTPELDEKALAVEVTQEAVFYDLTGQVLDTAAGVGDELGYCQEKAKIDLAIGVTNPYVYNGTAYNTYQTATPWINSHTNVLEDYTDIDNALQLFNAMTDPATGKEILVQPNTLLYMPQKQMLVNRVLNSTEVRETTNTNTVTIAPNPLTGRQFTLLTSQIAYNRVAGATGLNAGSTNGPKRWYLGDPKRAFAWMEAWPLRTRQAAATEYAMLDRGLVAAYFSNYRGIGAVLEPRHMVVNTH